MKRFRERENDILNNPHADLPPSVRIITENSYDKLLKRYRPEQLDRAKKFYEYATSSFAAFTRRAAGSRKVPTRRAEWPAC